jgi:periplasmic divalent cation tolerance protein
MRVHSLGASRVAGEPLASLARAGRSGDEFAPERADESPVRPEPSAEYGRGKQPTKGIPVADYLTVLTTTDAAVKAEALAAGAVEARLAACAQIEGPITSVYRWEGAIHTDPEWRVLYKTTRARFAELREHIVAAHDYDVPEIIATEIVDGSASYLAWIDEQTSPAE